MRLSTILTASLLTSTAAFAPNAPLHLNSRLSPLTMSTEAVNYVITGNNIEVTESLTEYVNKKLDNTVGKLAASGSIKECDVHFSVNKNPKVSTRSKQWDGVKSSHHSCWTLSVLSPSLVSSIKIAICALKYTKEFFFPNGYTYTVIHTCIVPYTTISSSISLTLAMSDHPSGQKITNMRSCNLCQGNYDPLRWRFRRYVRINRCRHRSSRPEA